jgi:glycosyltransferase involved in cell wall biosynthesis
MNCQRSGEFPVRADLHCHSNASSEAGEALLGAIDCPESFSLPGQVYIQAKQRGMDFITITDHDCTSGVRSLKQTDDLIIGEELTSYFPEDHCKMHVLVWGISQEDHNQLQADARDLYKVAEYIERNRIAHAVAHPLYRQNDRLEKWHVERLLLLFKGFECLNGAHSLLHRDAFEPMVTDLTEQQIAELAAEHGIEPRWPEPWRKARTGGSDDHGLFNIGRTWTEFPADVDTVEKLLEALRTGRCRPGGEAGSSLKLAHNFYSVGIQYYTQRMAKEPTASTRVLEALIGQRPLRKRDIVKAAVKKSVSAVGKRLGRAVIPPRKSSGTALADTLFRKSLTRRITSHPKLVGALRNGHAPLAEHEAVFSLISQVTRDTMGGITDSVIEGVAAGMVGPIFDALSSVAFQQFMLMPYYFALFHQNRERQLLPRLTGKIKPMDRANLRLGVFSDTFDEINGVSRFLRTIIREASSHGRSLTVQTCAPEQIAAEFPGRKNFCPLASFPFPGYPQLTLSLPPVAEILEWADRQQFDAIHVHTPGPMGLCGMLVGAMLRVPVLSTYHTDFPAYVMQHTGDHRLTVTAESFMGWFYGRCDSVFSRTRSYEQSLTRFGVDPSRIHTLPACVDTGTFNPEHRDPHFWMDRGIHAAHHLLYSGRVSTEKNLDVLADAFRLVCRKRSDVALVIAGEGPHTAALAEKARGLNVHFLGRQDDRQLGGLYANSDLLVFPSRTDTLGQVVLEAQASGLPVLVSDEGGPHEVMDDNLTGLVLPATDAGAWANAIEELLNDAPRRLRMARTAPTRVARYNPSRTFDAYWEQHVQAAVAAARHHAAGAAPPPQASGSSRTAQGAMEEAAV